MSAALHLLRDMRFGVRGFARRPLFALSLLLTLGLALAAGITTFGVLDAVLARRLPLRAPDRVFVGWTHDVERGFVHYPLAIPVVDALPDGLSTVEAIGAVPYFGTFEWLMETDAGAEEVQVATVTGDFFGALGATASAGVLPRQFTPTRGELAPLVLSHAFWQNRFGGADIIGTTVRFEGRPYEVRAIGPEGLSYPESVDAWAPFPASFLETTAGQSPLMDVIVRVGPNATLQNARAEMEQTVRRLHRELTGMDASRHSMVLQPLKDRVTGDARPWLRAVGLLVAVLLVVATMNATVLLLIRGLERQREIAVRTAVGATRGRLLRQLAIENLFIAAAACAIAFATAAWALDLLRASAPPGLPRADGIRLNLRVAAFAAAATLVLSTLLSLAAAWAALRHDPASVLRSGARFVGSAGARLRDALVAGQIAMTVLVLGAAGLLGRSLYNLSALETGFVTESLVLAKIAMPGQYYRDAAAVRRAFREIVPAVKAMPGVLSASGLLSDPFPGTMWDLAMTVEGQDATAARANPMISYEAVDDDYFSTLSPQLRRGRGIEENDRASAPLTVVINQTLAQQFWPNEDAIGKRIKFGGPDSPGEWRTVVGVVNDIRYRAFEHVQPTLYFHYDQGFSVLAPRYLAIRTVGGVPDIRQLNEIVARAAPRTVVVSSPTVRALLEKPLARPRFHVLLLSCFAATALLLSAVGIYGSLGTTVRQRRGELAVRLALGARPAQLRTLVLRRAAWIAAAGLAAGAAASALAFRVIASLLFGVAPADPATFTAAAFVVLITATAAAWLPARSATTTDPNAVLRAE